MWSCKLRGGPLGGGLGRSGEGGWVGKKKPHYIWSLHVCRSKWQRWLAVNWTLGLPIKATAQKATEEKNKGNTCTCTNSTNIHTLSFFVYFPWDFIMSVVKGLLREKGHGLTRTMFTLTHRHKWVCSEGANTTHIDVSVYTQFGRGSWWPGGLQQ